MCDLLREALAMARLGYRVFPVHGVRPDGACTCRKGPDCPSPGKHPCLRGWQKLATTDSARIEEFWLDWPGANPGIAPGPGQVVIDIDGMAGLDAYLAHARLTTLPEDTLVVRSGGCRPGKVHVYHALPPGVRLKNGRRLPEVDVKADGGFVVGPGGRHKSGGRYLAISQGRPGVSPVPAGLLAVLARKPASPASSAAPGARRGRAPAEPIKSRPGPRDTIEGQAEPAAVDRLLGRMIRRFPIEAVGQRDDQVFRMVGTLLGTGRSPADVRAIGHAYLDHFHDLGVIGTDPKDCRSLLDDQIGRTLERADSGDFSVTSEQDHVDRALGLGLTCWLDWIPERLIRGDRPAAGPAEGPPEPGSDILELGDPSLSGERNPSSIRKGDPKKSGEEANRYRGTRAGRAQQRAFLRAVLSWVLYKTLEHPAEAGILLTDGQIRRLMAGWGIAVEGDGPTIRRLKAKFFTQDRAATVFPFLVRASKGRMDRGRGVPSRYEISPALADAILSLPEAEWPGPGSERPFTADEEGEPRSG